MNNKQAKAMYRLSDVSGMVLGGIGTALLCVGEPIGLASMGVAFALLMAAVGFYGKAHPDRGSKKDKYYSYRNQ
nr:MAG TPA: hypothetical protein [Caudoviricetes sp.]